MSTSAPKVYFLATLGIVCFEVILTDNTNTVCANRSNNFQTHFRGKLIKLEIIIGLHINRLARAKERVREEEIDR